jgi:diacylglycerol kinase (ATP)
MIIVFNPTAGMRRASLLWRVLDVLVANGIRIELTETHRPGHAEALAREAVCGGASMVVAAGGDGTIAEVANGLLGSSARLGVIPLGSANVVAHELSLPFEPRAVAAALAFGRTRPLWPGMARGAEGTRLYSAAAPMRCRHCANWQAAASHRSTCVWTARRCRLPV